MAILSEIPINKYAVPVTLVLCFLLQSSTPTLTLDPDYTSMDDALKIKKSSLDILAAAGIGDGVLAIYRSFDGSTKKANRSKT